MSLTRRSLALLLLLAAGCSSGAPMSQSASRLTQQPFGHTPSGERIDVLTLTNLHGMEMRLMTYGGIILSLRVPDRQGRVEDVVLGHDTAEAYVPNPPFLGAIAGRYANRIAKGTFRLDGQPYTLATNDGANHLHGGRKGWDQVVWHADPFNDRRGVGVELSYTSPDGEEGYPGRVKAKVTYLLTDANALAVTYEATTDKPTIINLTQHTYFNLKGASAADILDHELTINADRYTPIDAGFIPTGELATVAGTPFDFRTATRIGARIAQDDEQLRRGHGYDHNFVLNRQGEGLNLAASVYEPTTGRTLDVRTTEPGMQFYSGNFLDGTVTGKNGVKYGQRAGFCLETQHYPDSPNHPDFPSVVLRPDRAYRSETVFSFGTR